MHVAHGYRCGPLQVRKGKAAVRMSLSGDTRIVPDTSPCMCAPSLKPVVVPLPLLLLPLDCAVCAPLFSIADQVP